MIRVGKSYRINLPLAKTEPDKGDTTGYWFPKNNEYGGQDSVNCRMEHVDPYLTMKAQSL